MDGVLYCALVGFSLGGWSNVIEACLVEGVHRGGRRCAGRQRVWFGFEELVIVGRRVDVGGLVAGRVDGCPERNVGDLEHAWYGGR